jgi:hypothetical protein
MTANATMATTIAQIDGSAAGAIPRSATLTRNSSHAVDITSMCSTAVSRPEWPSPMGMKSRKPASIAITAVATPSA